ncbi:MAG: 30S ribosome-binding factor RbfA [Bdellovibrionales bacterium]
MKNTGDGRRVSRVEKEVQIQIARYLISGFSQSLPGIVTVSSVRMPADLRTAKVFISVLGSDEETENVLELLQGRAFEIQNFIGRELKMRYCPKLTFLKDHTTEQVIKIEKILHDLKQTKTEAKNDEE